MEKHNVYPWIRVMQRELHRLFHDRTLQFITLIGPGVAFILIAWVFSSNVPRKLPVAVVDMDHTDLSRKIAEMIDATPIAKVNRNFFSLWEGKKAIENGTEEAVVYIPEGTEKNIDRGLTSKVAVYIENANIVKGGLLSSGLRKAISTLSAQIKLKVQLGSGFTLHQALSRIMPVQLREVILFNPFTSYSYYLTAALMPVLLVVFVLLSSVYVIGDELYHGTGPNWLRSGNGRIWICLLGKLLPYTLIFLSWAMVLNYILFVRLGMPLHGNFMIIGLGEILLVLSYQSFAIIFVSLTSNLRLSLSLGSAYAMLALTYSGLTFPVLGMPVFSQVFSKIFPFTYWIKILISQSLRGEPAIHILTPVVYLVAFILLGLCFIPLLGKTLVNRKRWGKI